MRAVIGSKNLADKMVWGGQSPTTVFEAKREYAYYLLHMRTAAGLKAFEVSRLIGISQSSYSHYERGQSLPRQLADFHYKFNKVIQAVMAQRKSEECETDTANFN